MCDIRQLIIQQFIKTGRVPNPGSIARKAGLDLATFRRRLQTTERLSNMKGLSPEQAHRLIEAFGSGVLFKANIELSLKRLKIVRKEIEKKEKKFK